MMKKASSDCQWDATHQVRSYDNGRWIRLFKVEWAEFFTSDCIINHIPFSTGPGKGSNIQRPEAFANIQRYMIMSNNESMAMIVDARSIAHLIFS